jgi:hypothetical protein
VHNNQPYQTLRIPVVLRVLCAASSARIAGDEMTKGRGPP